jgi:hypothetical protein
MDLKKMIEAEQQRLRQSSEALLLRHDEFAETIAARWGDTLAADLRVIAETGGVMAKLMALLLTHKAGNSLLNKVAEDCQRATNSLLAQALARKFDPDHDNAKQQIEMVLSLFDHMMKAQLQVATEMIDAQKRIAELLKKGE